MISINSKLGKTNCKLRSVKITILYSQYHIKRRSAPSGMLRFIGINIQSCSSHWRHTFIPSKIIFLLCLQRIANWYLFADAQEINQVVPGSSVCNHGNVVSKLLSVQTEDCPYKSKVEHDLGDQGYFTITKVTMMWNGRCLLGMCRMHVLMDYCPKSDLQSLVCG